MNVVNDIVDVCMLFNAGRLLIRDDICIPSPNAEACVGAGRAPPATRTPVDMVGFELYIKVITDVDRRI